MAEYINREDVLDIIRESILDLESRSDNEQLQTVIKQIPAADVVERKKGKWVGRSENDCYPVCSECGRTRLGSSLWYCQKYVPFCEHCGADMRGEDDD